jgi:hypothetical protein
MEQPKKQPEWMKKMGIVTGALLMGLGAYLLWKNDPNVNRPLAIFMTLYGAFRLGMAIYQMKNPPADNLPPTDETTPTH